MRKEDVKTKEDLIEYLNSDPDNLPFLESLWEKCVKKAEEDSKKKNPTRRVEIVQKDGTVVTKEKAGGFLIKNPISWYFRLMNIKQYKDEALKLRKEMLEEEYENSDDGVRVSFGDNDDIANWIEMFDKLSERKYLQQRYSSYMANYDINEGADRVSLSRILSLEIELYRINIKRSKGQAIDINREDKLTKMLRDTLESMKWTKKQYDKDAEDKENKFTLWMDKMVKQGEFIPEEHEIPKDEIDMLIDIVPKAVARMFD